MRHSQAGQAIIGLDKLMDPEQDMINALAMPKQAELRAYHPTWRDKLAAALMGEGRPSVPKRDFVQGLFGSSGLGTTGMGLVDATPIGGVLGAQEAAVNDKPADFLLNTAGTAAMIPQGRALLKGAAEAVKAAPRLAATLGGFGGAAVASEAGADNAPAATTGATAAPQYLVPMPPQIDPSAKGYRRPRNDSERAIHQTLLQQWQQSEAQARAEKAKQEGDTAKALALEGKKGEIAAQERKDAEVARTKREGAPTVLPDWALPAASAAALGIPAAVKMRGQYLTNQFNKRMGQGAQDVLGSLRSGDLPEASYAGDMVRELLKAKTPVNEVPWPVQAASAAIPLEVAGFPLARDLLRPSDTDANKQAWENMKDPWYWAGRIAPQAVSGASASTFGSHLPPLWPVRPDAAPEAAGALKSLAGAKSAATKKAKKSEKSN